MDLKRFFVDKSYFNNDTILVTDLEHNHLCNVLRLKKGDHIIVVCGDGYDYECEIAEISKKQTIVTIVNKSKNIYDPKINITFYQSILKGDNMPLVVQKLNELGVSKFVPFTSKYSVALGNKNLVSKLQNTSNQSAKQCKRSIATKIEDITTIKDIVNDFKNYDLVLVPFEKENSTTLQNAISSVIKPQNIAVVIGCEGGFDIQEIEYLSKYNAVPVTLGNRILRAETASIAVASALMYAFGEWSK